MTRARILPSRTSHFFERLQPAQCLFTGITTHLGRWLQTGTAGRAFRLAEDAATQLAVQVHTGNPGRLGQRRNRGSDAAGAATWATAHHERGFMHPAIVADVSPAHGKTLGINENRRPLRGGGEPLLTD